MFHFIRNEGFLVKMALVKNETFLSSVAIL
jgi:hypothetical protein